jgi:hypothetical protein
VEQRLQSDRLADFALRKVQLERWWQWRWDQNPLLIMKDSLILVKLSGPF